MELPATQVFRLNGPRPNMGGLECSTSLQVEEIAINMHTLINSEPFQFCFTQEEFVDFIDHLKAPFVYYHHLHFVEFQR